MLRHCGYFSFRSAGHSLGLFLTYFIKSSLFYHNLLTSTYFYWQRMAGKEVGELLKFSAV